MVAGFWISVALFFLGAVIAFLNIFLRKNYNMDSMFFVHSLAWLSSSIGWLGIIIFGIMWIVAQFTA